MATAVGTPVSPDSARIPQGIAPLRAGEGIHFLLRRLHSLTGIIPIGAFLLEHYISNSEAMGGPAAYNAQVKFLNSLPFVRVLEWGGIFIPLLFHALYGFYIWWRGEGNAGPAYPWTGNWMYTAQRWTGGIAFIYIAYHTWTMRFAGVHLPTNPDAGFTKVYDAFAGHPWIVGFYVVGIVTASWHFAYGLWLFCAKWGITTGEKARTRLGYICLALGVALIAMGIYSIAGFVSYTGPLPSGAVAALRH